MKTQTYGIFDAYGLGSPHSKPFDHKNPPIAFLANRLNGTSPVKVLDTDWPQDGTLTWTKGKEKDGVDYKGGPVYGVEHAPGKYGYELRYDAGPRDLEWMENKDRDYVFRLEWRGKLDRDEPNLEKEVPALYAEVMAIRAAKEAGERLPLLVQQQEQARRDADALREQIATLQEQQQTQRAEFQRQFTVLQTQFQQLLKQQEAELTQQQETAEQTIADLRDEVNKLQFFKANSKHLWQEAIAAKDLKKVRQLIAAEVSPHGVCVIPIMEELTEYAEMLRTQGGICTVAHLQQDLEVAVDQLGHGLLERAYLETFTYWYTAVASELA